MKKVLIIVFAIISIPSFSQDSEGIYRKALIEYNKKVIDNFYNALEQKDGKILGEVFDFNARFFNSYTSNISGDTIEGRAAIVKHLLTLSENFETVKYKKEVLVLDDAAQLMVKLKVDLETKEGQQISNNSLATFRLKNGKITEYVEYSNSPEIATSLLKKN